MTLSGTQIQQTAREIAAALDDVSSGRPLTPRLEVWKAGVSRRIVEDLVNDSYALAASHRTAGES